MKKMQIPSQEIWCEALSPTSLTNLGAVLQVDSRILLLCGMVQRRPRLGACRK